VEGDQAGGFEGPLCKSEATRQPFPCLAQRHRPDHRGAGSGAASMPKLGNMPIEPGRSPTAVGMAKLDDPFPDGFGMLGVHRETCRPQTLQGIGAGRRGFDGCRHDQASGDLPFCKALMITRESHANRPRHHGDRAIGVVTGAGLARCFIKERQGERRLGVLGDRCQCLDAVPRVGTASRCFQSFPRIGARKLLRPHASHDGGGRRRRRTPIWLS
jgi:hypothetical protein